MSINGLPVGGNYKSNNPKRWYDEILPFLILAPALIIFIPVMAIKCNWQNLIIFIPVMAIKCNWQNFKINKRAVALLTGYIFCCVTVLWLVWSIG